MPAIGFAQDSAAASRKHAERLLGQFVDDGFFDIAKRCLAFALEKFPDRAAQTLLDHMVGVGERQSEPAGQLTPYRRFATSGQTDKTDQLQLRRQQGATARIAPGWSSSGCIEASLPKAAMLVRGINGRELATKRGNPPNTVVIVTLMNLGADRPTIINDRYCCRSLGAL